MLESSEARSDAARPDDDSGRGRLFALNASRATAEAQGQIRWLRLDYQNPTTPAPDCRLQ